MIDKKGKSENIPINTASRSQEKTVIKSLALGGLLGGGAPCAVDTQDGKVVRIRPLHYDWKYSREGMNSWKFERNGKTFELNFKTLPAPFSLAYKKRVFSPNRIKYPLKRVDWAPDGERNPQNRGKSKYKRISWDEAAELVASELIRVKSKYGAFSVLLQGDGHGECKTIHAAHGCPRLLLDRIGGFTQQIRNPDSWEGWYWGAKHVWGEADVGLMHPSDNVTKDINDNTEQLLLWGCDPETTSWGFVGQIASLLCYFWGQAGMKQIYICPDLNYGAAVHADKWIPVLPNTDAALQLAIIYTWINEGTYDKAYVATHVVGFEKLQDYVLGKEDGLPKTPEWASTRCGVPEWTIKALARQFAANITSIAHTCGGGMVRGPYSHEPSRLEVILLGMQGLGKPGVHQYNLIGRAGMPTSKPGSTGMKDGAFGSPALKELLKPHGITAFVNTKQHIPKTLLQEAILNSPITYWGTGAIMASPEDQFIKYTYPIPKEEGGTEIHMIWTDTPCRTTCWNDGNKTIEAMRSPKIECIVAQHPWLENDCLIADIILPGNTTLEVDDLVTNNRSGAQFLVSAIQRQAAKPVGESKSDYEIVLEIARKMGLYEEITGGKSIDDLIKVVYEGTGLKDVIGWEELQEKSYYVHPISPGWEKVTPGLRNFYNDPEKYPLPTPSGKLEFYSERLAKNFPNDEERAPIPKWVEKGITHDENHSSERAKIFPLLMMSNHGRWRMHAQCDDISWTREVPTCKVEGWDGYKYEPLWLNPVEASKRKIKSGDIVKVFNERGIVLCAAYVTERLMAGVAYADHGARCDWIIPGKLDRGGAVNLITPNGTSSRHCGGQATSGFLVEVEKVSMTQMEEWKSQYPDAFKREYDSASGLCFNAWIEESK
jgi:molybdopterin guanine dinucleotide-containing S/N-oxide reductase-like protein